jgi:hypothetical protein
MYGIPLKGWGNRVSGGLRWLGSAAELSVAAGFQVSAYARSMSVWIRACAVRAAGFFGVVFFELAIVELAVLMMALVAQVSPCGLLGYSGA